MKQCLKAAQLVQEYTAKCVNNVHFFELRVWRIYLYVFVKSGKCLLGFVPLNPTYGV
eukprot:UN04568